MAIDLFKETRIKLKEFARFLEMDLRENLITNNFTGELSKSIKIKVDQKKLKITLSFAEHGIFLDEGTRPHMPPVSEIRPWAQSKGLNEWAVAKSIAKKGTKAHPWLYTWDDAQFNERLKQLLGTGVESDLDTWVKNIKTKE